MSLLARPFFVNRLCTTLSSQRFLRLPSERGHPLVNQGVTTIYADGSLRAEKYAGVGCFCDCGDYKLKVSNMLGGTSSSYTCSYVEVIAVLRAMDWILRVLRIMGKSDHSLPRFITIKTDFLPLVNALERGSYGKGNLAAMFGEVAKRINECRELSIYVVVKHTMKKNGEYGHRESHKYANLGSVGSLLQACSVECPLSLVPHWLHQDHEY